MLISPSNNLSKNRSPSAINIHSFKINNLKKKSSALRLTSAINSPKLKNHLNLNLNSKHSFKPNSLYLNFTNKKLLRKNNSQKELDTNYNTFNSNNFFLKSPRSINSSKREYSKESDIMKKNKNIFEYYYLKGKEKIEEENRKIQSVLSELVIWDNKQLIENNEIFKEAKIFCEKEKERLRTQKKYSEKNQEFNENKSGWFYSDENDKKNFEMKFSVFDKNYDMNKNKKEEQKKKQKILNDMKNNYEDDLKKVSKKFSLLESLKERSKFEDLNRDQLMKIYNYIIENKLKKKKYKEISDSTFSLLNKARSECKLSVDLLRERIRSVQKYYEAYIESMNKLSKVNESEKRKLNYMEKYEEKINKYREYLSICEEINKEIKSYEDKYELVKEDLEAFISQIKVKIDAISAEINKFKYLYNELKEQQIEYYLEKLKKGIDTRNEGLSWIVKKLMEFRTKVEPNSFPNFLDQEQINYIMQISKLGFECNQVKQIVSSLREKKQDLMKNKYKDKNKNSVKNKRILLKEIKHNGLAEDIDFEVDFNDCFGELIKEKGEINKKITDLQEKFSKKEGISLNIKYKIENEKLNLITNKIKNKINIYANTRDNKLFENKLNNRDKLMIYLFGEGEEKEIFKDIYLLSDRAKNLDDTMHKLKNDEYLIFLEKMKLYEIKREKMSKYYTKIYNALFGNTYFEIKSKCNLNSNG